MADEERAARRRRTGLTQTEVAQRAGLSIGTVHRYERGDELAARTVRRINQALEGPTVSAEPAVGEVVHSTLVCPACMTALRVVLA